MFVSRNLNNGGVAEFQVGNEIKSYDVNRGRAVTTPSNGQNLLQICGLMFGTVSPGWCDNITDYLIQNPGREKVFYWGKTLAGIQRGVGCVDIGMLVVINGRYEYNHNGYYVAGDSFELVGKITDVAIGGKGMTTVADIQSQYPNGEAGEGNANLIQFMNDTYGGTDINANTPMSGYELEVLKISAGGNVVYGNASVIAPRGRAINSNQHGVYIV